MEGSMSICHYRKGRKIGGEFYLWERPGVFHQPTKSKEPTHPQSMSRSESKTYVGESCA